MKHVLALSHIRKSYDGKVILDDVTLAFSPGVKIGVVGPSGTGKSTLLKMMGGLEPPSDGVVLRMPGDSLGLLAQESELDDAKTVLGNVEDGVAETRTLLDRYNEVAANPTAGCSGRLLDQMGGLQEQLDHRAAWDLDARLAQAMDALRCPPPGVQAAVLSGGKRRRVALCRLLLSQPELLLLDEPANDLDTETLASLENALKEFAGCAVITSHDRWFLDRVATHRLAWEGGVGRFWFDGNFTAYQQNKAIRLGDDPARPHRLTHRQLTR